MAGLSRPVRLSERGLSDLQLRRSIHVSNGHTYLYTLERAVKHIDHDDLYIHEIFPKPGSPLFGAPLVADGADDTNANNGKPEIALHTVGLLNPDGILGVVRGSSPLKIIYGG